MGEFANQGICLCSIRFCVLAGAEVPGLFFAINDAQVV
jgi:hypothetical protein